MVREDKCCKYKTIEEYKKQKQPSLSLRIKSEMCHRVNPHKSHCSPHDHGNHSDCFDFVPDSELASFY